MDIIKNIKDKLNEDTSINSFAMRKVQADDSETPLRSTRQTEKRSSLPTLVTSYLTAIPSPPSSTLQEDNKISRGCVSSKRAMPPSNLPDLLQVTTITKRCPSPFPPRQLLVLPPPPAAHLPPSLPLRPPAGSPCVRPPSFLPIRSESTQSSPSQSPCAGFPSQNIRFNSTQQNILFRSTGTMKIASMSSQKSLNGVFQTPSASMGEDIAADSTMKSDNLQIPKFSNQKLPMLSSSEALNKKDTELPVLNKSNALHIADEEHIFSSSEAIHKEDKERHMYSSSEALYKDVKERHLFSSSEALHKEDKERPMFSSSGTLHKEDKKRLVFSSMEALHKKDESVAKGAVAANFGHNVATSPKVEPNTSTRKELVQTKKKRWFPEKKEEGQEVKHIIPLEIQSLRHFSVADVITNALLVYRKSQAAVLSQSKQTTNQNQSGLIKSSQCAKCARSFGLFSSSQICSRCRKSFCDKCVQKKLDDSKTANNSNSSFTLICVICVSEVEQETSRGATRGLWSEFQTLRREARESAGKSANAANSNRPTELPDVRDLTPGLHNLCQKFIRELQQHLDRQLRHTFFTSYRHTDISVPKSPKTNRKTKECPSCKKPLRLLNDSHTCSLCLKLFCEGCTYPTLQLFLPVGTDLKVDLSTKQIKFHVLADQQDEITTIEASEIYRVCGECESLFQKNVKIVDFNSKIHEIEQEMFDLQRQIDYALSFNPVMYNMSRSRSVAYINQMADDDVGTGSFKTANKLYERYIREYEVLSHMLPETPGQKLLHKHIKQAMYEFYLLRRHQLRSTLRRRDSMVSLANDF